jgi:hypothetical protein
MPAPIWTEGPSRPSAIPLASEIEQHRNLPASYLTPNLVTSTCLLKSQRRESFEATHSGNS